MNKKLRAFLEANGLRADATEQEAWELWDKLKARGVELPGIEEGTRSAVPGAAPGNGNQQPATPDGGRQTVGVTQAEVDAAVAAALAADAGRRSEIEDRLSIAGLGGHDNGNFARTMLLDPTCTVERAATMIFAELKKRNQAVGSGVHGSGLSVGRESRDKVRAAVTDGLLIRSGHLVENPAAGYREFRGRHLVEICRELMHVAGIDTRGMGNMDMVSRALASGNTTDFPLILGALVNKSLQKAYTEWPATWRPFCAVSSANDFKAMYSLKLSGAPDLQGLNENGEYKTAKFSEAGESYRVVTKGIKVPLTRQMIINDDTRAFSRIPQLFGSSAARMENAAVYSLINANGAMADGVALFHADHNNLAGANAAISSDSLGLARAGMRKQKGLNNESIDIIPAFLLCPVVLETTADILLMSAALPTAEMSSGVHNPWAGKLTPISDPLLDANSLTAWYMLAHPNQAALIEVAWLEGEQQPYVEEQIDFNSDALVIKVRHDFGAGVVDHVAGYKNIGA